MKTAIMVLLCIVIGVPAFAQPPVNGTYKSTDIGGTMLPGRYSESWVGGGKLSPDNTLHEQSWDGATLGTQWNWVCPWIASPPTLLVNTVNGSGNGQKIWRVTYAGGYVYLDGAGPWGGGDPTYSAAVYSWIAIVTETYANFLEVGTVRNHNAAATFTGYNSQCINLAISNLEKLGDTVKTGPVPADFPDLWSSLGCSAVGGDGEWGDVDSITFSVTGCETVSTEEKSWGAVKAMYRK